MESDSWTGTNDRFGFGFVTRRVLEVW